MTRSPATPDHPGADANVSRRRFLTGAGAAIGALAVSDPALARAVTTDGAPHPLQYDVTQFGALGDGQADDTTSIQNAIEAARAAGGGTVAFPAGVFRITGALTIYSNITLRGAGIETTKIRKSNGAGAYPIVSSPGFDPDGPPPTPIRSFSLENLTLDGNYAGGTGGNGLQVYAWGYTVINVTIHSCAGRGIWSENRSLNAPADGKLIEAMYVNVGVHDCVSGGIYYNGPNDSEWVNVNVFRCGPPGVQSGSTTKGIELGQYAAGIRATNVHSWGLNQRYAWWLDTDGPGLVNCMGEGAEGAQVVVLGNDAQILGGKYFSARPTNDTVAFQIGTEDHIGPAGTFINTKIVNCNLGAIRFVRDRGIGRYIISVWQTSGSAIVREAHSDVLRNNRFDVDVNGGATAGTEPFAPVTFQEGVLARRGFTAQGDVGVGAAGSRVGFYGVPPQSRSSGWSATGLPDVRHLDQASDLQQVRAVLATLVDELRRYGLIGGTGTQP